MRRTGPRRSVACCAPIPLSQIFVVRDIHNIRDWIKLHLAGIPMRLMIDGRLCRVDVQTTEKI